MQYLLTEEEFQNLVPKKDYEALVEAMEVARQIIVALSVGEACGKTYCTSCPISCDARFHEYQDSPVPTHDQMKLICRREKHWPK